MFKVTQSNGVVPRRALNRCSMQCPLVDLLAGNSNASKPIRLSVRKNLNKRLPKNSFQNRALLMGLSVRETRWGRLFMCSWAVEQIRREILSRWCHPIGYPFPLFPYWSFIVDPMAPFTVRINLSHRLRVTHRWNEKKETEREKEKEKETICVYEIDCS